MEHPEADRNRGNEEQDLIGKLRLALYGTREAAAAWQTDVARHLIASGWQKGLFNPQLFCHSNRHIRLMVHGHDDVASGARNRLMWLGADMEKTVGI